MTFFRLSLMIASAAGFLLELVDFLRRLGLSQRVVDRLACLLGKGVQIRRLRARHTLVARHPLIGILLRTSAAIFALAIALFHHVSPCWASYRRPPAGEAGRVPNKCRTA